MNPDYPPIYRTCGASDRLLHLLGEDSKFHTCQIDLEQATQKRAADAEQPPITPVTIPVVVHIVYATEEDNISDAQIQSQIDVLNQDFRALNPDKVNTPSVWAGLVTDTMLAFKLAEIDPEGNPTDGITRTKTEKESFMTNLDDVKFSAEGGEDAWPSDRYLNIWVCRTLKSGSNSILGYASWPGERDEYPEKDGVVIIHTAFGTEGTVDFIYANETPNPFNLGRTATHEIGHWLNLRHIWGDDNYDWMDPCKGTDYVEDTPNQEGPNYGSLGDGLTFPRISCNNAPNGDMFMNYMDYVNDDTMIMFTPQQVLRMRVALEQESPTFLGQGNGEGNGADDGETGEGSETGDGGENGEGDGEGAEQP